MNSFRNTVFADNIKLGYRWALNPMVNIFLREERKPWAQRHTGRKACEHRGRDWSHELQTEQPAAQELERQQKTLQREQDLGLLASGSRRQ